MQLKRHQILAISGILVIIIAVAAVAGSWLYIRHRNGNLSNSTSSSASGNQNSSKTPIEGLVDMGVQADYLQALPFAPVNLLELGSQADAFSATVVNASWAQLEPTQGSYNWSVIDNSLATISTYNQQHPNTPLAAKFRIFGGNTAPNWAKSIDGSPLTLTNAKGETVIVGRWWTSAYDAAWKAFQTALAERYDNNPLVKETAITSCASLTGEPFVLPHTATAISTLESAGWTSALQQQCLSNALNDYSAWKNTYVDFAFNPFVAINQNSGTLDVAFTQSIMQACAESASRGGPHCILGNNDLGLTNTGFSNTGLIDVYHEFNTLETQNHTMNVYFQMFNPTITNSATLACQAIQTAIEHHARSIELWPPRGHLKGFSNISESTLASWSFALKHQSSLTCS